MLVASRSVIWRKSKMVVAITSPVILGKWRNDRNSSRISLFLSTKRKQRASSSLLLLVTSSASTLNHRAALISSIKSLRITSWPMIVMISFWILGEVYLEFIFASPIPTICCRRTSSCLAIICRAARKFPGLPLYCVTSLAAASLSTTLSLSPLRAMHWRPQNSTASATVLMICRFLSMFSSSHRRSVHLSYSMMWICNRVAQWCGCNHCI